MPPRKASGSRFPLQVLATLVSRAAVGFPLQSLTRAQTAHFAKTLATMQQVLIRKNLIWVAMIAMLSNIGCNSGRFKASSWNSEKAQRRFGPVVEESKSILVSKLATASTDTLPPMRTASFGARCSKKILVVPDSTLRIPNLADLHAFYQGQFLLVVNGSVQDEIELTHYRYQTGTEEVYFSCRDCKEPCLVSNRGPGF